MTNFLGKKKGRTYNLQKISLLKNKAQTFDKREFAVKYEITSE